MKRKFLAIGILGLILFLANSCLAAPPGETPTRISPGSLIEGEVTDIPTVTEFRWTHVAGATEYILKIREFAYDIDDLNIGEECYLEDNTVIFPILEVGKSLDFLTTYHWKVAACNVDGCSAFQDEWYVFSTVSTPTAPPPPPPPGGEGGGPIGLINPLKATTLWEAINALINFLLLLAFAIAPILIIYAAFLIMTAGGKAEQVNKGKTIILWTLVAVAIVLLAKGLPSVVKGIFGG